MFWTMVQRYLFTHGANNCSCAVESEGDWSCVVDLQYMKKVAQLSFHIGRKGGFYTLHPWEFLSRADIWRRRERFLLHIGYLLNYTDARKYSEKYNIFYVTERSTVHANKKYISFFWTFVISGLEFFWISLFLWASGSTCWFLPAFSD
jgi:hypothetical protein